MMVHKVVTRLVARCKALRNKRKRKKEQKLSKQWDQLYTSSDIEDECDSDITNWPFFINTKPSPLDDLPIEILEIIVSAVVRLPDFYSAASFAATSRLHRKLVRSALIKLYRQPLLSEIEFRDLLMVDCSIFGLKCLEEYRRDWWFRWVNSDKPSKRIDRWQTSQEARLLEGRNGTLLVAGIKSYRIASEQTQDGEG